jgi:glyoxylase-like metal-dependent hydrolase (beta-lactamase superfamily II)
MRLATLAAASILIAIPALAADAQRAPLPPGTSYVREGSEFAVTQIRPALFALSEPDYYQHNVSYVIVGEDRALVIDAGASTTEDITRAVRRLTDKPFAVIPTHLHYDHIGSIHHFQEVWMIDVPATRELVRKDGFTYVPPDRHIATAAEFSATPFKVSRYIKPGETVDLGDRPVQILFTPGHTRDEIVIYSPLDNILFTGDFIYPAGLFSGNATDYLTSANNVLATINSDTKIYGAHAGPAKDGVRDLPLVTYDELVKARATFQRMAKGAPPDETIANSSPTGSFKMTAAKVYRSSPRIRVLGDIVFADRGALSY